MSSDLKVTNIKHESSGSNNLVLASDGNVSITNTLSAGTIGGGVSMASSGLTVRNITQVPLASNQSIVSSTTLTTLFSPTYTPLFSGSKVQGILTFMGFAYYTASNDSRKYFVFEYTGSGITDITTYENYNLGGYSYSGGIEFYYYFNVGGPLLTTSTTDTITANVKLRNHVSNSGSKIGLYGNNTTQQTFMTWIEYK